MRVTERLIWASLCMIWLLGIAAFFFYQRCERQEKLHPSPAIKYVSLPKDISKVKTGDTLTVDINDDTLLIRYFEKGQNQPEENFIIIK